MYQIINSQTSELIEESITPTWVKQQESVDFPIKANNLEEADGIVLSDGVTYVGIEGRNMQNYTPLIRVVEIPYDVFLMGEINRVKEQVKAVQSGVAEVYNVQTEGAVPKTDLDTAYREGVNSYGE